MTRRLNITNGDGAAEVLKATEIDGEFLIWHDLMFEGPFPAGLDLAKTSELRAEYFGQHYPKDKDASATFRDRDQSLCATDDFDSITLWYEHDLLDQLQILQILDWFATAGIDRHKLRLLCIDAFPGIKPFLGLGQLQPQDIGELQPVPICAKQLETAQSGWKAFRSPDPRAMEAFLRQDSGSLPFLGNALRRHLEEFPATDDGLSRTERQLLEIVSAGVGEPGALFAENMARENVFFMGDWSTFRHVGELCGGPRPLLRCAGKEGFKFPPGHGLAMAEFRA